MVSIVGKTADGRVIGEENGVLLRGQRVTIPRSSLDRVVENGIATYSYKGEVYGRGSVGELRPEYDPDRDEFGEIEVIEWERT